MKNHWIVSLGIVAAMLHSASRATPTTAPEGRPNVLLILIDTLRPDHLGAYGHGRPTSPVLDDLARRSAVFEAAFSQASWTKPSIPSLLTGTYPIQHRVFTGNKRDAPGRITSDVLAPHHVTLAEVLSEAGYATIGIVHNRQISGFMGFDQGFDAYVEEAGDAFQIGALFEDWLAARPGGPFFAYLHYLDPHWPYDAPESFVSRFDPPASPLRVGSADWKALQRRLDSGQAHPTDDDVEALEAHYDAEIRYLDAALGQLLATLRGAGLEDDTLVVVTSDHGEELFDHGGLGHGRSLYDELLRVPLLVSGPGIAPRRIDDQVQLVDVLPTLLDHLALPIPAPVAGRSLVPLLDGEPLPPAPAFADHRPGGDRGRLFQSVRHDGYKLIRSYRLGGSAPRPEARPELHTGRWYEVDGEALSEGYLQAFEIEPIPERDDVSLTAEVRRWQPEQGRLLLNGVPCTLDDATRILDAAGEPVGAAAIDDGLWVKAKGRRWTDGRLQLRKLQLRPDDASREAELKAPIDGLEGAPETSAVRMAGIRVLIDDDTDFEDFPVPDATPEPLPSASEADAPERRLLTRQLYHLRTDPREQLDRAAELPEQVERLDRMLDGWEQRYDDAAAGVDGIALDQDTLDRLRALGYVD